MGQGHCGEHGDLMVSIVASQHTGRGFDTNCGQPLFVFLGKALNLTSPLTTHEYNGYQSSWGVILQQTGVLSRGDIVLSCLRYRNRKKHWRFGPFEA